jgi:hypothetical protein
MAQALMVSLLFRILDQEILIQFQPEKIDVFELYIAENKENNQSSRLLCLISCI